MLRRACWRLVSSGKRVRRVRPHAVERIAAVAAVTLGLLLDVLAGQVQFGAGQGHHVEGVHDRGGLGQHFGGGGLVAAESVHGHNVDLVAERRWLVGQPPGQRRR